ncbi:MAG TPA: hypothetical protein VKT25_10595 [Ktedonobacteraceae bacterium]|nr:hypothetical protein [Ktedonobacteraceae bacterium]
MAEAPVKTPDRKRSRVSYRVKVILFLVGIAILAVLTLLYAPHERDSSNATGDALPITVTVTNQLGSLNVNRAVDYQQARITVTTVTQASAFSDDQKRGGNYTIRVALQAKNTSAQQAPIGINYAAVARLRLSNGQVIAPKLVSMSPVILPHATVSGYIDFAVSTPEQLSSVALLLGTSATLPFAQ